MKKVIHIVENLDKGAVEMWLVRMFLICVKKNPEIEWTFYCILSRRGRLDDQVIAAGGKIIYSPYELSQKWSFLLYLRQTLKRGNYDIIHSHHDYLSGLYLITTIGLRLNQKILHIHNTDEELPMGNVYVKRILLVLAKQLALRINDTIIGVSDEALNFFLKNTGSKRITNQVIYCGISMEPFFRKLNKTEKKEGLGFSKEDKILLFVGRMNKVKNPVFVVDILKEVLKTDINYHAVFIGNGDEYESVKRRAIELNILNNIHLFGWRDDIHEMMQIADAFVFPRLENPKEALGLVVIEAQASGLPVFISKGILQEAIIFPENVHYIDNILEPKSWSDEILRFKIGDIQYESNSFKKNLLNSVFEENNAAFNLIQLYEK